MTAAKLYDIYNPTRAPRVLYDGIEGSQRSYRIGPGDRLQKVPLADHIVKDLVERKDDLRLTPRGSHNLPQPAPAPAPVLRTKKPPIIVDGMYGIGDNLHQRAAIHG